MSNKTDDIVRRINGLLTQAANTTNPNERDTFMAGAMRLAAKYSITEAMLAEGEETSGGVKEVVIELPDRYSKEYGSLANAIARPFGVEAIMISKGYGVKGYKEVRLTGFEADLEMIGTIYIATAPELTKLLSGAGSKSIKLNRSAGFRGRISERLKEEIVAAIAEEDEELDDISYEGKGTALVLLDKTAQVEETFRERYPRTKSIRTNTGYDPTAQQRGRTAANNADLSTRRRLNG